MKEERRKNQIRWSQVFTRSTLGDNVFSIRGAYSRDVEDILNSWGLDLKWYSSGSPINASLDEKYCGFLDGGYSQLRGNYFIGLRGQWIVGFKALYFMINELRLKPPTRRLAGQVQRIDPDKVKLELIDQIKFKSGELDTNRIELEHMITDYRFGS